MVELPAGIFVAHLDKRICTRIVGRGTFQNSQPLRRFAMEKIDRGHEEFIFDLEHCPNMDSTFVGVLAVIGLRLRQCHPSAVMHLININPRNLDMLQTLGLDRLFLINGDIPALPADADYQQLPDTDITQLRQPLDKRETADLMTEAHDNLARVDPRNTPRFKELARILREANKASASRAPFR